VTAYAYLLQPQMCLVAVDTLGSHLDGPVRFVSKYVLLPELRVIVFGGGRMRLLYRLAEWIALRAVVRDVTVLDRLVPDALRTIIAELDDPSNLAGEYSQVNIVGYSRLEQSMVGYRYCSSDDFASERLPMPSLGLNPDSSRATTVAMAALAEMADGRKTVREFAIDVLSTQKAEDDEKPLDDPDRFMIGGEIQLVVIGPESINVETIWEFPDADRHFDEMLEAVDQLVIGPTP